MKNETKYDRPIETAIPAEVAIKPPPIAPNKPFVLAPSIAPLARELPKPVIGNVAAGEPILAEQNIEDYFPVPADMVPKGESFILKVRGDSMINVGIFSGDRIFVNSCNTANNGDMVVAMIEDGATVKTFYKENGHIRLQPENDNMDPIIVDDCQIVGKVFGVFRFYR